MATAGDGNAPYEKKLEINEEPQNVSQEAVQNNSTGVSELNTHKGGDFASFSATIGIPELEQIAKHKTFTRSEAQHHSKTMEEESPSPLLRPEASTTSGSLKNREHGDESDNFHAAIFSSRVLEEEIAELAKAHEGLKLINNNNNNNNNATSTCLSKAPMASPQHSATMEMLPEELLSSIFIRLLAKQLAQMRSVNKSWNALLSESSFVKSHLNRSFHNNDQILLVFHDEEDSKPFQAQLCQYPCLELINLIKFPVNPQSENISGITVIGSVNGLICSSYNDGSVIQIWNPSLSAVLTLPPYSTPSSHGHNLIENFFKFGFDPKTDDYKVVKLACLTMPPPKYDVEGWLQVEIYSMRKGTWELITERFPSHITHVMSDDYVCADGHDGHLHWLCFSTEKMHSETIIVAFGLGSETFHEIPLPHSVLDHNRKNMLGRLAGKLYVMSQYEVEDKDVGCEVWVMEEYGVAESWVKRHVFSQFKYYNTWPLGFTSHNEFLVEDNDNLVMYDPSTKEQKILENHCLAGHGVDKVVEYVDSLVWVAPLTCG